MDLVSIVMAFVGGTAFWFVVNTMYTSLRLGRLAKENVKLLGNIMALQVKKHALDRITDKALKARVTEDLNKSGDAFDEGWDLGLKGIKL